MTAGMETLAKVRRLHDSTTSPGEKAAAANRMEALARSAGMTVAEALSKLDNTSSGKGGGFADFFDTPPFRDAKARRDREREARWREVLAEYGSEAAVFSPTGWERALDAACDRYVVHGETTGWRLGSLSGWDRFGDPPAHIVEAVSNAYPMPANVQEAWSEFQAWEKLGRDREARGTGCGDHSAPVDARRRLIERVLDTMPSHSLNDVRARMSWLEWRNELGSASDQKGDRVRLATLRADIERMGQRLREQDAGAFGNSDPKAAGPVHSGHAHRPSRAKRHAAIRALLAEGHGDREIARRLGISPTTVGTVRRATQPEGMVGGD